MYSTSFKEFEHHGWQSVADGYEDYFLQLTQQTVDALLQAARVDSGMKVLDIASGPGLVAASAAKLGADVTAIDFAAVMVDKARKNYPGIDFRLGDAEYLDFPDESFDAALMNFGILHLENPERAISEARRVLSKGGVFAFSVWAPPPESKAFDVVLQAIEKCGNPKAPIPPGPPFFRFSNLEESSRVLAEAGFAKTSINTVKLSWILAQPEDLFNAFYHGTPRTGGLLRAQTTEQLQLIKQEIISSARDYEANARIIVPMAAFIASAEKFTSID